VSPSEEKAFTETANIRRAKQEFFALRRRFPVRDEVAHQLDQILQSMRLAHCDAVTQRQTQVRCGDLQGALWWPIKPFHKHKSDRRQPAGESFTMSPIHIMQTQDESTVDR
jgi:hypothetical protein